jgi:hypothetical protein
LRWMGSLVAELFQPISALIAMLPIVLLPIVLLLMMVLAVLAVLASLPLVGRDLTRCLFYLTKKHCHQGEAIMVQYCLWVCRPYV